MSSGKKTKDVWRARFSRFTTVMKLCDEGLRDRDLLDVVWQAIIRNDMITVSADEIRLVRKPTVLSVRFPLFRTLTFGTKTSVANYRTAMLAVGNQIGIRAEQMLANVSVSTEQVTYNLFVATVAELGFPKGATFAQIRERVVELGYQLCPAEVGLALRLVYTDQPMGELLRIVMEPIFGFDDNPRVFNVVHDGEDRLLSSYWVGPDDVWGPDCRWVFCRPGAGRGEQVRP